MTRRSHRPLYSLSLAASLLWASATPAIAWDVPPAAGESDLQAAEAVAPEETPLELDEAVATEGPRLDLEASPAGHIDAAAGTQLSDLRLAAPHAAHRLAQQVAAQAAVSATPKKKKGVGRWLKKHWWVPVLAAAAVGFAVSSSGDDDSSGEED